MRAGSLALALVALLSPLALADDQSWEPPKDGVLTEKQVDAWIDHSQKLIRASQQQLKWLDEHKDADMAAILRRNEAFKAEQEKLVKASGLAPAELEWVGQEAMAIHTVHWLWTEKLKPDWDAKAKEANEKVAALEKTKADVEKAKKSGRRVLTPEERAQAQASADEQVKACEQALKEAKEAKEGEAEAQKNLADAKKRAKDVDLPQTPDEKAENDRDLAEREQRAKEELDAARAQRDELTKMVKEFQEKEVDGELKKHPAKNVEIVKARSKKIQANVDLALKGPEKDEKK